MTTLPVTASFVSRARALDRAMDEFNGGRGCEG